MKKALPTRYLVMWVNGIKKEKKKITATLNRLELQGKE